MSAPPFGYGTWRPFGRYGFMWSDMQPTKGSYVGNNTNADRANMVFNWTQVDAWVQDAIDNNIKILWPVWGTPEWAAVGADQVGGAVIRGPWTGNPAFPPGEGAVPQSTQFIRDFIRALLGRYNTGAAVINRIEQRNEPFPANSGWTGTMVQLVTEGAAVYQATKAADARVKVLSPPFYSGTHFAQWLTTVDPVTGLAGHQTCDEISVHTYAAGPNKAMTGQDLWHMNALGAGEAYRIMDSLGIARKPYSVTEWGLSESLPNAIDFFAGTTAAFRRDYIGRILAMAAINGCQCFVIFGYNALAGNYVADTEGVMAAVNDVHTRVAGRTLVEPKGYLHDGRVVATTIDGARWVWDGTFTSTINFAEMTARQLQSRFGWTRTGAGTLIDSGGAVRYGAHNLLLQTETFASPWTSDLNVAAPVTGQLDSAGTSKAAFFASTSAAIAVHRAYQGVQQLRANTLYTWDVEVKPVGAYSIAVVGAHTGIAENACFVSCTGPGSVLSPGSGNSVVVTAKPNGYYRIQVTRMSHGSEIAGFITVQTTGAVGDTVPPTPVGQGFNIAFPALYIGGPNDYVPTTAAPVYLMRTPDHTFGAPGLLLLEGARTNLTARSNNFTASEWATQGGVTLTPNATISPDGTMNATQLVMTSSAFIYCSNATSTGQHTASIWLKGTIGDKFALRLIDPSGDGPVQVFTIASSGWVRYSLSGSPPNVSGQMSFGIETRNFVVPGTGTAINCFIYGAQLEAGAYPTSYTPNPSTGTVTRAADVAEIGPGVEFDALFPPRRLGPDLVTNGDFSAGAAGWTVGLGCAVSGAALVATNAPSNSVTNAQTGRSFVAGKRYLVEFDYANTAGTLYVDFGGATSLVAGMAGTSGRRSVVLTPTSNASTLNVGTWAPSGTTTGSIDNISVREVIREGTMVVEWVDVGSVGGDLMLLHANGSLSESMGLYLSGRNLIFWARANGVTQATASLGTVSTGVVRAAFSWGASGLSAVMSGGSVVSLTSALVPAPTHARFAGGSQVSGSIAAWKPVRITSLIDQKIGSALQALLA